MKVILLPIILVLFILFYKRNSLLCLGIFGISYYIANISIKNKNICFLVAILSSFYIYEYTKVLEGNENIDNVRGCGEELEDTQELACNPSNDGCDWTAKKLKINIKKCKQVLRDLDSQEAATSEPNKRAKIKADKKKYNTRLTHLKEAIKQCNKYTEENNCPNTCKWENDMCNEK